MKTFIIFAFSLFLLIPALGQKTNTFGLKAGYINSWVSDPEFNSNTSFSGRSMASAGLFYNRSLHKNYSIQVEALYSMKGYKRTIDLGFSSQTGTASSTTIAHNADYVEVPILFKAGFGEAIKPFINIGVAPAFNVKDQYNSFKPFDLGLITSLGLDIPLSKNVYTFLELRLSSGLLRSHEPYYSNSTFKNSSLYIFTGLAF